MLKSVDFAEHLRIFFGYGRVSAVGEDDGFCAIQVRFFQPEFFEIFRVVRGIQSVLRGVAGGADYDICAKHRVCGKLAVFVGIRRVVSNGRGDEHPVF